MKEEKDILKQIDHRDGMTVPEGYFADFAARMADSLEKTPFEESESLVFKPAPMSLWQRMKPYVYMAAMFAGVWCMLKMFTLMSAKPSDALEPSPILAEALNNDIFVDHYIIDDVDTRSLMDEMMESGMTFDEFEDFFEVNEETFSEDLPE